MDAGWQVRALVRSLDQCVLPALAFAFLPGPGWIHWGAPLLLVVCVVFLSACYLDELRDRRLAQHDLPIPYREPPPRGF
jgi:hypothetical protein